MQLQGHLFRNSGHHDLCPYSYPELGAGVVIGSNNMEHCRYHRNICHSLLCCYNKQGRYPEGWSVRASQHPDTFIFHAHGTHRFTYMCLSPQPLWCLPFNLIKKQRKYYTSHLIEGGDAGWKTIVTAVLSFVALWCSAGYWFTAQLRLPWFSIFLR